MVINERKLEAWLRKHFRKVLWKGPEFSVDSIFVDDHKGHLWINPEKGKFHCWKTDKGGSIINLVKQIEHCDKSTAIRLVCDDAPDISNFNTKIQEFKSIMSTNDQQQKEQVKLPESFTPILPGKTHGVIGQKAVAYLKSRKIIPWKYRIGYCYKGECADSIVVPFYDDEGKLIYWTSRSFNRNALKQHLHPSRTVFGVKKSGVVWIHEPIGKTPSAFICEGVFDAMSLVECGINGVSILGRSISDTQARILATKYDKIVLATDNDQPAKESMNKNINRLRKFGAKHIGVCMPMRKDWNEMLVKDGKEAILEHIRHNESDADFETLISWNLRNLTV